MGGDGGGIRVKLFLWGGEYLLLLWGRGILNGAEEEWRKV